MSIDQRRSVSTRGDVNDRLPMKIARYVPALNWLPRYTQLSAVSDFIAGVTLGLTMIPQSIAYAALAGLSAQYGLYSSFVGVFVYVIFGTIKEVSIGATSLMAILTLEYTRDMPVEFVVLLTFLAGCVELAMGILNLGFLVDFISIPVTSGFTSATSVIIIVSQLQGLLGLKYKSSNILESFVKIWKNLGNVRLADFGLGVSCIIFLLTFRKLKDVKFLSEKNDDSQDSLARKTMRKVPWLLSISRNALIVLITSTIAARMEVTGTSPFILSGKVVPGLPRISLPPFSSRHGNETYTFVDMCMHYKSGILVVPVIAVLANVAIAKAFACGAAVNASQEMLTLGLCNILGSLASSMPSCGAFTRSAVSSASGVQTPMAGVYSGIMTLLALSFLTPYFYYIPRATLSAVLISAVIFMIDWKIVKLLWKGCKSDAVMALVTFVLCIICNVEVGLIVGVFLNLALLLRPTVRPNFVVTECKTPSGNKYMMLKVDNSLCFPAVENFCSKVLETDAKCREAEMPLIIDCQLVVAVDYTSIKGFERVLKKVNTKKPRLYFLNVNQDVSNSIEFLADTNLFHIIDCEENLDNIFYENNCNDVGEKGIKLQCFPMQSTNDEILNQNGTNKSRPSVSEKEELETLLTNVKAVDEDICSAPSPHTNKR